MLSDYRTWMIWPPGMGHFGMASPLGPRDRVMRRAADAGRVDFSPPVSVLNGVATVVVDGVITRRPEWEQAYFDGVSSELLTAILEKIAADEQVEAIVLRIDSPGGEAAGMAEAAAAVRAAAAAKPVYAIADRTMASGAYFLATGATKVLAASKDARIGSIGTLLMYYDWSKHFEERGIAPVVISTGPYKATGALGTETTAEQREYLQKMVNETQKGFTEAIMLGRGLTAAQVELASDGRMFSVDEAQELGLIDGLMSYETAVSELRKFAAASRGKGVASMSAQTNAATLDELSLLPGVTDSFLVEAQRNKWTLDQASSTWMERQQAALTEATAKAAAAESEAEAAKAAAQLAASQGAAGVDPGHVAEGGAGQAAPAAGASAAFRAQFEGNLAKGMPREAAMRSAVAADPAGHEAYLQEYNSTHESPDALRRKLTRR